MTFKKALSYEPSSLVAAAYQSTTNQAYGNLDNIAALAGYAGTGTWTGNGNAIFRYSTALDQKDADANWFEAVSTITLTSSTVSLGYLSDGKGSVTDGNPVPPLPYGRAQIEIQSTDAGGLQIDDLICSILGDFK